MCVLLHPVYRLLFHCWLVEIYDFFPISSFLIVIFDFFLPWSLARSCQSKLLGQLMAEEIKGSVSVDEIRMLVDAVNSSPLKVEGKVGIDGKVDLEGNIGASIKPKLF